MPSCSVSKWTRVAAALMALSAGCGSSDSSIDDPAGSDGPTGDATTGATGTTTGTESSATTDTNTTSTTSTTSTATTGSTMGSGGATSGGTGMDGSNDSTAGTLSTTNTSGGAGGTGSGAGGSGASGGSAGSGGTSTEACPTEPPSAESACAASGQICAYEDCAGEGRSIARCFDGAWTVENSVCGDSVVCENSESGMCDSGNVCLIVAGGAIFGGECIPNTCETGPVSCDCIEGCSGTCSVTGDPSYGITIMCNTCPSGLCP